jgi:serine/threonine protein kinase
LREHWPVDRLPIIGAYHCIDRIGEGASGVVYAAVDLDQRPRLVALKLLRFIADEDKRRFFEREVEILKALDLPHVARYLASGSFRGTAYLAMEWARGLPLDEFLATRTAQLAEKLAIFEKVAAAVAELHAAGVIHRDLKPRHIIVDDTGEVCIVDLGLSAVRPVTGPRKSAARKLAWAGSSGPSSICRPSRPGADSIAPITAPISGPWV